MGSYCSHILGIFSIMRYRSLRRFPVPLVTTGSGKRRPDAEGIQGFPLGIVVRGGESERGRGGTSLEEGPPKGPTHLAPFWSPFRRSKIVLKKQCQK